MVTDHELQMRQQSGKFMRYISFRCNYLTSGSRGDPPLWNILRLVRTIHLPVDMPVSVVTCLALKIIKTRVKTRMIFPEDIRIQRLCRNQSLSLSPSGLSHVAIPVDIWHECEISGFMPTNFLYSDMKIRLPGLTHEKL